MPKQTARDNRIHTAVSYTHLDVYKRQPQRTSPAPRQKYLPEKQVTAVILPLSRLFSESEHRRSPCSLTAAVLFLRTRESPPFRKSGLLLTFLFVDFIICSIPVNVNSFFDKRFEYIGKIYFTFPALTNGAGQDTISIRQRIGFARRKTKEIGKDE